MEAYTVIKQLLLPPGILLILLALAFLLVRGTLGRMLLFIAWSLMLIMSLPGLAYPMIAVLEHHRAIAPGQVHDTGAQAIVVLGAGTYTDAPEYGADTVAGNSLERIRYAAWLHRRTGLPIYVTGGSGGDAPGPPMAQVLRDEFQVPVARVEDQSRTTWENAGLTAPLLRADGIGRVLLVTHAWHMPRAVAAFERVGVSVIPAPTYFIHRSPGKNGGAPGRGNYTDWLPQAGAFMLSAYAVHEVLGQAWYGLRGLFDGAPQPVAATAP